MNIPDEIHGIPSGLSSDEVARLVAEGKVNITDDKIGKSYSKIVRDNLFTYFNLIWAIITLTLILCDSYSNLTFLVVVILNTLIAIIQEIKAKRAVEKLSVTTDPKATVMRDSRTTVINASDIVLGDVILVEAGKQIPCDAIVISGIAEANESLLTGESRAIRKEAGAEILAGSFLVSGSIYARVHKVGKDNYVHKIEKAAKSFKAPASNLFRDLNRLIKSIGIIMIPIATLGFIGNYIAYPDISEAIIKTCGSLTAMIPGGIYLLVTMTLTLSVITLSKKRTLVQDMYSIEMLASADVVCLDKTGTITDGTMAVTDFVILDGTSEREFRRIMSIVIGCERSLNNTSRALANYFGKDVSLYDIQEQIPFSSSRKYSAVSIKGIGSYSIGAPKFVPCPINEDIDFILNSYAARGDRVMLLAKHESLDKEGTPLALIMLSDRIRPAAQKTIDKFQKQGVTLKVISGDHAQTVSAIAKKVGINNADKYISCESLSDEELSSIAERYAVFGRVTPEQKVLLVKQLKKNGHTVAMTGDGVNDTLALKESNCAIAMADGSEVARKISQIVLLDSDFSTLPDVVHEGRRCINNVRQSSSLFLMKTIFTLLVSIMSIITLSGYPFAPNQTFFLELLIIGFASILLALEPNNKRIRGSFLETVIIKSVPNALAMFAPVLIIMVIEKSASISLNCRNAIAMSVVTMVGYLNLVHICRPFSKWRAGVVITVGVLLATVIPVSIFALNDIFNMSYIAESYTTFTIMAIVGFVCAMVMHNFSHRIQKAMEKRLRNNLFKKKGIRKKFFRK